MPVTPSTCPDENTLTAYLDGSLQQGHHVALQAHIEQCHDCTELLVHMAHLLIPAPSAPLSPVGQTIQQYHVKRPLGKGGMGMVFEAFDTQLHRRVALKMVRQDPYDTHQRKQLKKRLIREARTLASIAHPHILPVYDIGEWDGQIFVAMQLVEGTDLRAWLVQQTPDWRTILDRFLQAAKGLWAAHKHGLVHRDIKPDNFLMSREEHVYLADFGLVASNVSPEWSAHQDTQQLRLTQAGTLVGTPGYIAPEICGGQPASPLTDQFSFCVALYESLYKQKPYPTTPEHIHLQAISQGLFLAPPPSPIPNAILPILQKGMSPTPRERFDNMGAFIDAIKHCLQHKQTTPIQTITPDTPAPRSNMTLAGLFLGGLGLGLLALWTIIHFTTPHTNVPLPQRPPKQTTHKTKRITPQPQTKQRPSKPSLLTQPTPKKHRQRTVKRRLTTRKKGSTPTKRPTRRQRPTLHRRSVSKMTPPSGDHCTQISQRYQQTNRKGWEAFASPQGRQLWKQHTQCLYQKGKCKQAWYLDKQYVTLLAAQRQNAAFTAFGNALKQCRRTPFLQQLHQPLQRAFGRVTSYYAKGIRFCHNMTIGLLQKHGRSIKNSTWAEQEDWKTLLEKGVRCMALPLQKRHTTTRQMRQTCQRVLQAEQQLQRSLRQPFRQDSFDTRYARCKGL